MSKFSKAFRKWNRIIHRDFGYFFFGMTVIYSISGIAINHRNDWNPNYNISYTNVTVENILSKQEINEAYVVDFLKQWGEGDNYKKHFFPSRNELKIFLQNSGSIFINLDTKEGYFERIRKRPFFYEMNFLHYNPGSWWTWFSDIFAVCLIILAISGILIINKGTNSLKGRGAWLTIAGIVVPLIAVFILG